MESPVATALCAVSSVSLNHRHDAPPAFAEATAARQGRGYNIQETASGSDKSAFLHAGKMNRSPRLILFVSFIDAICALPQSPIDGQVPKRHSERNYENDQTHIH